MPITVGVRVESNKFDQIASSLKPKVDQIIRKTCADIIGAAIMRTLRVDTGAMKAGYRFERVEDLRYIVYNLMHYHIYHELGTVSIQAMPMLIPALEQMRRVFSEAITVVLSRGI